MTAQRFKNWHGPYLGGWGLLNQTGCGRKQRRRPVLQGLKPEHADVPPYSFWRDFQEL